MRQIWIFTSQTIRSMFQHHDPRALCVRNRFQITWWCLQIEAAFAEESFESSLQIKDASKTWKGVALSSLQIKDDPKSWKRITLKSREKILQLVNQQASGQNRSLMRASCGITNTSVKTKKPNTDGELIVRPELAITCEKLFGTAASAKVRQIFPV